jgi:uncharacterized protein with PhoU and TrkA domain
VATEREEDLTAETRATALKEMVQTDGWKLFVAEIEKRHGPAAVGYAIMSLTAQLPASADRAYEIAQLVERLQMTCAAVNELIKWPEEQIRMVQEPKAKGPFAGLRRVPR